MKKSDQLAGFKQRVLKVAMTSAVVLAGVGFGVNAYAANATATATAKVISPIGITKSTDMAFGSFAKGAGGTVTLNTDGSRANSGTILSTVGGPVSAASFAVSGDTNASYTYSVSTSGTSANLASTGTPADTMALSICTSVTAAASCAPGSNISSGTLTTGAQTIYVGGVLTVGANQVAHQDYTGTVSVTVEYN